MRGHAAHRAGTGDGRAGLEPHDAVGVRHHLGAVGDEQHGPAGAQPLDGAAHVLHARGIEIGGRLVEDDERRVAQEGARQPDPPALPRRQRAPPSPTSVS